MIILTSQIKTHGRAHGRTHKHRTKTLTAKSNATQADLTTSNQELPYTSIQLCVLLKQQLFFFTGVTLLVLVSVILQSCTNIGTAACEDFDTEACKLLHIKNHDICEGIAGQTACKRFCGNCGMEVSMYLIKFQTTFYKT